MLELYGHPFSSYTWKALIALYENQTPFEFRLIDGEFPENIARLEQLSPQKKFPLLVDGDRSIFESSIIIEYLQHYYPGSIRLLPSEFDLALKVRMFDRFFDNYVMKPMQDIVSDFIRAPDDRDAITVKSAKESLQRSYAWLDQQLGNHRFVCGDHFTLADCSAAPSLFYSDWVFEIEGGLSALRNYRSALLARPSVRQCVDDARPYRQFFPPGAPDRD